MAGRQAAGRVLPGGHALGPLGGKVALVTGASRGLGLAMARALAVAGCDLVITGRDRRALEAAARSLQETGARVLAQTCDVRQPGSVDRLLAATRKNFRRLDILINNAGISHPNHPVEKLPLRIWQEVIDTNLTGMFLCTRAALPLMGSGAAIVNNLSISATRVFPGAAAYNASKHGALGFTRTLREELRERGIRVIALLPGAADTAIWEQFWPSAPRKRMLPPEAVAAAVVNALALPANAVVEELTILPIAGAL